MVNFTNLNKVCSKDPFPIPQIDQLVDATFGHPRISFLDSFQGYHQRLLALSDQEKTTFWDPTRNYHYCVTRMFESQIGRNVEAYIDDMVIKSRQIKEHLTARESS